MGVFQHSAEDTVQVLPGLDKLSQEAYVDALRQEFGPCAQRVVSKHRDRIIAISPDNTCRAFDAAEADTLFDHGTNLQQMVVDIVARLRHAREGSWGNGQVDLPVNVANLPIRAARAGMTIPVNANGDYALVMADYVDTYYDLAFKNRGRNNFTYSMQPQHCGDIFVNNVPLGNRIVPRMLIHTLRTSGLRGCADRSGWIYVSSYNSRPLTQFLDQRPVLLLVGTDALYYVPIGLSQAEVGNNSMCFVCKVSFNNNTITVESLGKTYGQGNINTCPAPPN
jgi:hypothetical protein